MTSRPYLRHIDGLRALSIILVLLFHFHGASMPGGFVGVDVFFVISGFLIINLIVRDLEQGTFSAVTFWNRRIRRLAPAIAATLLVSLAAGALVMAPSDYRALGANALLAMSSLLNVSLIGRTDYFAESVTQNPVVHFWSLAVEEQFYIVLPLMAGGVFALAGRERGRKACIALLLALGAASFAGGEWLLRAGHQNAAYYLMPTRFGQLASGGVLALLVYGPKGFEHLGRMPTWGADILTVSGVAAIMYSAFTFNGYTPFPGLAALPVTVAALCCLAFGRVGYSRRLFENPVCDYLGPLSFSLYLIHWPVYAFVSYHLSRVPTLAESSALAAVAVFSSVVMHHGLERPVRFSARYAGRRMYRVVGPLVLAVAAAGALVYRAEGFPGRVAPGQQVLAADAAQFHLQNFGGLGYPEFEELVLGVRDRAPRVIVIGDSKMHQFALGVDESMAQRGQGALFYTDNGCGFLTSHAFLAGGRLDTACLASGERALALARRSDVPIIFSVAWGVYTDRVATREGTPVAISASDYAQLTADMLRAVANANPRRRRVFVLGSNAGFWNAQPIANCLARPTYLGLPCALQSSFSAKTYVPDDVERELARLLARDERIVIVPMQDVFCPSGPCTQIDADGTILFSDPAHLSKAGSRLFAPRLLAMLDR